MDDDTGAAQSRATRPHRVVAIDAARGLIIVMMALDHVRMYFTSATFDPLAIGITTPAYFFTRWVTHVCAPGFFFLAGLGSYLSESGSPTWRVSALLAARGAWLIILELTVVGFAWSFTLGWNWFGVIWSLGSAMVCLAFLRLLPRYLLLLGSGAFLLAHNLIPVGRLLPQNDLGHLLYTADDAFGRWVLFPVLPWLAVMVLGYAAGRWLMPNRDLRADRFAIAAIVAIIGFVALRTIGLGEPAGEGARWHASFSDQVLNFLNVEKYPPSTQFVLVTLGMLILVTAAFGVIEQKGSRKLLVPIAVVGRVPLFFYVAHLFLIHSLALTTAWVLNWPSENLFWSGMPHLTPLPGYGFGLAAVYVVWFVVLVVMWPACFAFGKLKDGSRSNWKKFL